MSRRSGSCAAVLVVRAAASRKMIREDGEQDEAALDRAFPVGRGEAEAEEDEDRADDAEQQHAEPRSDDRPLPAADRRSADDDRGDDEQLPPRAVAGLDLR